MRWLENAEHPASSHTRHLMTYSAAFTPDGRWICYAGTEGRLNVGSVEPFPDEPPAIWPPRPGETNPNVAERAPRSTWKGHTEGTVLSLAASAPRWPDAGLRRRGPNDPPLGAAHRAGPGPLGGPRHQRDGAGLPPRRPEADLRRRRRVAQTLGTSPPSAGSSPRWASIGDAATGSSDRLAEAGRTSRRLESSRGSNAPPIRARRGGAGERPALAGRPGSARTHPPRGRLLGAQNPRRRARRRATATQRA